MLLLLIYFSFISLGLPDGLLGAAWPSMYPEFGVSISKMGLVSIIISAGTVISSLKSDALTCRFGAGKVTAVSVGVTALAILGFSLSHSFAFLCVWAIPYGLGAGSIDAALNNYVALHYKSRHMSWLHCMWGVGAAIGPMIMGFALRFGQSWNRGYLYVGMIQLALTGVLIATLRMWKTADGSSSSDGERKPLSLSQVLKIPGVAAVMIAFFCYCAIEQTAAQWAASYLTVCHGFTAEDAARFASMFYIGITVGRGICGFITFRLDDAQMIRMGFAVTAVGIAMLFIPVSGLMIPGLIVIGLGCAPVYPSLIHATPAHFGADASQAVIGVQMASAYVGITLIPPLFGAVADLTGMDILPIYLFVFLALMVLSYLKLEKQTAHCSP